MKEKLFYSWWYYFICLVSLSGLEMGRGAPGDLLHRESCQVLEEQASSGGIKGNADNCKIAKIWGRAEGRHWNIAQIFGGMKGKIFFCQILGVGWKDFSIWFVYKSSVISSSSMSLFRWYSIHPKCLNCSWKRKDLRWVQDSTYFYSVQVSLVWSGIHSLSPR